MTFYRWEKLRKEGVFAKKISILAFICILFNIFALEIEITLMHMTTTLWFLDTVDTLNDYLLTYVVVVMLVACAIYFTFRSKGV